jgi:hypothetical protein
MEFAAGMTLAGGPVRAETLAARYDQLLTDSSLNMPAPDAISPPSAIPAIGLAVSALLAIALIMLGGVLWSVSEIPAGGVAATIVGLILLVLAARGWRVNRSLRGGAPHVATSLLQAADRAERQALARASAGDAATARSALELAADRLRALAPGSGRPHEVLERARKLREAAAGIRG